MSLDRISALHQNVIALVPQNSLLRVVKIHLIKGELTEPDEENFRAAWATLSKNTSLENSQLLITAIPSQAQCMICRQTYAPLNKKIICPFCGSFGAKILAGEELRLDHIETK